MAYEPEIPHTSSYKKDTRYDVPHKTRD